jgi:hypothetical protein
MAVQKVQVGAILAIAMTGVVVSVLAASLLMAYQSIPNTGNVKGVGVGVYWDSDCTSNVTSINWGFLEPGETASVTVYTQNKGSIPVVLNMTTDNWNPTSASDNITLSWNREGYVLNTTVPVVQTVLTLSVSPDTTGITSFSFDIIITGTEYT